MKFYQLTMLLFAMLIVFVNDASAKEFRLMLTSFDPFGGSAKNNTQEIVASLKKMSDKLGVDVKVDICNLPVIYDVAATTAMNCIEQFHPDSVISFGEAACSIQLETSATNWDGVPGFPDNAGQIRDGSIIVSDGVERTGYDFPVSDMYCTLDSSSPATVASIDPGAFVCNNTAYHLSEDLKIKRIPFTFIHVPNSRCSISDNLEKVTGALAAMITASINAMQIETRQASMPSNKLEAEIFLQDLQNQHAPACKIEFAGKILSLYQ